MKFNRNHPLLILTWKHLQERKRTCCHTIWEIMSGVLVFIMLLLMRQVIKHSNSNKAFTDIDEIIYTPNDPLTRKFMSNLTGTLRNKNPHILSEHTKITGFAGEAEMLNYLYKRDKSSTAVVLTFKEINYTQNKLDYTLDVVNAEKMNFSRSLRYFNIERQTPSQEFSYPAMLLQWNIDRTFMESASGNEIRHNLVMNTLKNNSTSARVVKVQMGIIHQFLIFCTVAAPLPFFLYNSSRLVIERRHGLKEMMQIAGVCPNIIRFSHLIDTALVSTIYATVITIMLKATETPILPESNAIIIAFTIILHFLNVTSLAFITSLLSNSYEHANGLALIVYVVSCALCSICHHNFNSKVQVYIVCWFLPHAPVYLFWDEVKELEKIGVGSTFNNMASLGGGDVNKICVPVLVSWLMFVVQLVLILFLAWYMDMVRPGQHGVAVKWDFIFKRQYWRPRKKVTFHVTVEQTKRVLRDDRYFQKPPLRGPVAIKISQLTKTYRGGSKEPVTALDSISIDAYEGEVTVILGVHDCGKSTLLSIVAGMLSATSGHVYVKGLDTSSRIRDVRESLGLCPQHNLTFDYLTVKENIVFFQRIKRQKYDARLSADYLVDRLHLRDYADYFSYQLSASQERCLQVACALAGNADVLILDEPTAKCDATTRHTLWDVILTLRGDKTVFMTTSSIEEADAVADRIALLNHGKLKCFGTPLFLKNALGTGVNLSLKLMENSQTDTIKGIVHKMMPESIFETDENEDAGLTFMLPSKCREIFPQLFLALEERTKELGIKNMRVGMCLEQMFFRFIYEKDEDPLEHKKLVQTFEDIKEVTGWRLHEQRMRVLMVRNFCHMWSVRYKFIILQMIVPVLGLIVISVTTNSHSSLRGSGPPFWKEHLNFRTAIIDAGPARRHNLDKVQRLIPDLTVLQSRSVSNDFKNLSSKASTREEQNVIGVEMHGDHTKLFMNSNSQAEASKALNIFSNVFMSLLMPYSNAPITMASSNTTKIKYFVPKETILCLLWSMWVAFIFTLPLTPFIGMTIQEYNSGVRYTHFMVGCPHIMHWLAKMAAHTIMFLAIMPLAVFLCAEFLDYEHTLNQREFQGVLFLAQLIFVPAFLLKLYVLSFFLNEQHAVSLIYIQSLALGFSAPIIQILLEELSEINISYRVPMIILSFLGRLSPVFTLSELISKFTSTARIKAFCKHNEKYCGTVLPNNRNLIMLAQVCCGPRKDDHQYFKGTHLELVAFAFHVLFYSALLIAVQKNWIQNWFERVANSNYRETTPPVYADINVYNEKTVARRMMTCIKKPELCYGAKPARDMLLVDNLHKQYVGLCWKARNRNAVRGVSFYVKAGESLVLLGQTDSGKTTTLLMVAGATSVTKGDCYVFGKLLSKHRSKYLQKVSFTKSTGGLDGFYTGYQNLKILSLLHGYNVRQAERIAVSCTGYMGLHQYLHQPVHTYSVPRARRLGLCAALLAAPRAVLLDEPMHALNPYARRCVARAFASLMQSGSALLVAEHTMDWRTLDTVYTNAAILCKGRIVAIGSCNHIRDMLANGHSVRLKLKLKSIRTYVYEGSSESSGSDEGADTSSISSKRRGSNATADSKDNSDEDMTSPSFGSKLERALIDKHRGNVSRLTLEKKKSKVKHVKKKPRTKEAQEKYRASSTTSSDKTSSSVHAASYDNLATGIRKAVLRRLIADFLSKFPNSELTDEHLPMLYFHVRSDMEHDMPYSVMFSKLETLRSAYQDILEDYSLGELTVEDVYWQLEKDEDNMGSLYI